MNNQKGFTLIEMLVVVAIIGLLSSVVVVGIGGAREKARDTKRIADLRSIQSYLEMNYTTEYPDIAATYPASLPTDPSTAAHYSYCRSTDPLNQKYALGTTLENAASRQSGGIAAADLPTGCVLSPAITCAIGATDKVYCIKN